MHNFKTRTPLLSYSILLHHYPLTTTMHNHLIYYSPTLSYYIILLHLPTLPFISPSPTTTSSYHAQSPLLLLSNCILHDPTTPSTNITIRILLSYFNLLCHPSHGSHSSRLSGISNEFCNSSPRPGISNECYKSLPKPGNRNELSNRHK